MNKKNENPGEIPNNSAMYLHKNELFIFVVYKSVLS